MYSLFLFFYRTTIALASPFNAKAKKAIHERNKSITRLYHSLASNNSPIVWFHAASMGEFEQGLPVMKAYKMAFPHHKLLVTFFSPSGYQYRKDHPIIDFAAYLPWDTPRNARKFVSTVQPEIVFFIKYEFWFHLLKKIHAHSTPLFSISARFVEDQIFFKWYGRLHRQMLTFFDHIFVQDQNSLRLLQRINIQKASYSGDNRFDNVMEKAQRIEPIEKIESFKADKKLFIIGSGWIEDLEILFPFIQNHPKDLKILIAPHDVSATNLKRMTSLVGQDFCLFSEGKNMSRSIMILDTIGQLAKAYQYAELAYIGGAFGDGLHNTLEATAFGIPVVFGNGNLDKFPEATELLKREGAFAVNNKEEAAEVLNELYTDKALYERYSKNCLAYMHEMRGATDRIMNKILETL